MATFHTQVLTIEGMHGDDSVHGVSYALGLLPGVRVQSVELGHARVMAEPSSEGNIREALQCAGFTLAAAQLEG